MMSHKNKMRHKSQISRMSQMEHTRQGRNPKTASGETGELPGPARSRTHNKRRSRLVSPLCTTNPGTLPVCEDRVRKKKGQERRQMREGGRKRGSTKHRLDKCLRGRTHSVSPPHLRRRLSNAPPCRVRNHTPLTTHHTPHTTHHTPHTTHHTPHTTHHTPHTTHHTPHTTHHTPHTTHHTPHTTHHTPHTTHHTAHTSSEERSSLLEACQMLLALKSLVCL
jgi:hypothetical protein